MFWDSSALLAALIPEARSEGITDRLRSDTKPVAWWASPIECRSALERRRREERLPAGDLKRAVDRLAWFIQDLDFVAPSLKLRERADQLLTAHPLRAGDALQLAAALVWSDDAPRGQSFVCLDDQLSEAARREGFAVVP